MSKSILVLTVVLVALVGCTSPAADPTPEPTPEPTLEPTPEVKPETVVAAAMEAWNAGDVETLKAFFAGDAVVCFPDWGDECTTGAEEIGDWIEELVAANFSIEPESVESEGDTVTVVAKVWADPTRKLDIAPLVTTDIYTIRDDKIVSQTSTLTEESAASLQAALASQPSAVVVAYVEAINAGDLEAAMALLHEDLYADLIPTLFPTFQNLSGGKKDDIRAWLEEMTALNLEIETEILSETGDTITARSKIWSDYLRELDAAPIVVNEEMQVRDGQVRSWKRTITENSMKRLQESLGRSGIAATIAPESGEELVSAADDLVGIWMYTLIGESAALEFDPDGDFFIRSPTGKVGNTAQFWFEEGLLLVETKNAGRTDYCGNGTGSYVVFATREGGETVKLRLHEILDLCDLRSGALTGDPLTPADEG